jgi:hypothetical protein
MAIVTVKIHLRRSDGRNRVELSDLVAALTDALLDLDELEVVDVAGEDASYEVTRVDLHTAPTAAEPPPAEVACEECGQVVVDDPHGRPRRFCSGACRIRAHRTRLQRS